MNGLQCAVSFAQMVAQTFFFTVDCWLNNAWVLLKHDRFTRHEKVYRQRLQFHMDVAHTVIAPWLDESLTCKVDCLRHPTAIHYSCQRPHLWCRCIVCKKKTRYRCTTCSGAHMCVDRCFVKVYTMQKWALRVTRPSRVAGERVEAADGNGDLWYA